MMMSGRPGELWPEVRDVSGPPLIIGYGPRWAIVWLGTSQGSNGDWLHAYSIIPGRVVVITVRPGAGTLPAYDDTYAAILAGIAADYPASA